MIKIICVGKIKEKFYAEAIDEYLKRLSKYAKIQIICVNDEKIKEKALEKEAEAILKNIKKDDYVITLDLNGQELSSIEFASKLDQTLIKHSDIDFVIGGSYGLDEKVKNRSDYALSFSKMTFPHQLFRVILLEQIYRGFKIINNETYHK